MGLLRWVRPGVTAELLCDWSTVGKTFCAKKSSVTLHGAPQKKIAKTDPTETSGSGENNCYRGQSTIPLVPHSLFHSSASSLTLLVSHCLFFKAILFPRSLIIRRQRESPFVLTQPFIYTCKFHHPLLLPPVFFCQKYPVADPTFLLEDLERTNEVYSTSAMPFSPPDDVGILAMGIYFPNQVPFHIHFARLTIILVCGTVRT